MIDDHSRKLLACPVRRDESGQSASDAMEMALETAQREGHVIEARPTLLTDSHGGRRARPLVGRRRDAGGVPG